METPLIGTCASCFFARYHIDRPGLICHRYPPFHGLRAVTYPADWCGEYVENDEDEPETKA
jgi:hypothetical protein